MGKCKIKLNSCCNIDFIQGPPGPQGPPGEQGPQGEPGPPGVLSTAYIQFSNTGIGLGGLEIPVDDPIPWGMSGTGFDPETELSLGISLNGSGDGFIYEDTGIYQVSYKIPQLSLDSSDVGVEVYINGTPLNYTLNSVDPTIDTYIRDTFLIAIATPNSELQVFVEGIGSLFLTNSINNIDTSLTFSSFKIAEI